MPTMLYDITLDGRYLAVVKAIEDPTTATAYHLWEGKHMRPDYAAIREALPARLRKAYDRSKPWWFPRGAGETIRAPRENNIHLHASCNLYGSRGKALGRLAATPYLL